MDLRHQLNHPGQRNQIYFFGQGLEYDIGSNIFVFGSNERGNHGLGAAQKAVEYYGAIMGIGYGLMGQSFAVPTKDQWLRPLSIEQIAVYAYEFVKFTQSHPDLGFYLTPVGTGYAHYQHHQIAPLFKGVQNCWIPHLWQHHLINY